MFAAATTARRAAELGAGDGSFQSWPDASSTPHPPPAKCCPMWSRPWAICAKIYVDGGIRRGGDVLKAVALGARAVLVGRPIFVGFGRRRRRRRVAGVGNPKTRARRSDAALRLCEAQRGRWNVVAALASSCRRRRRIGARARAFLSRRRRQRAANTEKSFRQPKRERGPHGSQRLLDPTSRAAP